MLNFDHAASTPVHPDVIRTIAEVMQVHNGNPSSIHRNGEASAKLLERSREVCAGALGGVKPEEIIFTSGATESNNLAVKGMLLGRSDGRRHIVTTTIEHASVYESCKQMEQLGFEVTYVKPQLDGTLSPEDIFAAVRKDTVLVSVMHVNNETGAVQPVTEIGRQLKKIQPHVRFHVDGVQGFAQVPLDLREAGIDLYSLSAHKLRGPRGVGLLYIREGITLFPLLSGGDQEQGLRAGTENVASIVGAAKAFRLVSESRTERAAKMNLLREQIIEAVNQHPTLTVTNPQHPSPHIVHFTFPGLKSEVILHTLEGLGAYVSAQSACSAKTEKPSRVLLSMGRTSEEALSGIRISLGDEHEAYDIQQLSKILHQAIDVLQPLEGRKR